jgi:hypothetical protein
VVSSNQSGKCGKEVKLQVTPFEVTPKICGQGVGGLFKTSVKTSYKQPYPQLSTPYPQSGGRGYGELFNI